MGINWKTLNEIPSPYKERYGNDLKKIEGMAIIDDDFFTDNSKIKKRLEDFNSKSMRPYWVAHLIIKNGFILKNKFGISNIFFK